MSVFKPADHDRLIGQVGQGALRGVLIYGADSGGVGELSKRLINAVTGGSGDPLSITTLDDDICRSDPARLADEAQSVSMFGGRTAIRVRAAGEAFAKAMENVLSSPPGDAVIIAEAGPLKPASKLRKLFEKSKELACAPIYEDTAQDIGKVIRETLSGHGLSIAPDAMSALSALLGADRAASRGELEKLALYCMGQDRVTLEDVEAICGDVSAHAMDAMLDAFFTGDVAGGTRLLAALLEEGVTPARILSAASGHVAMLTTLSLAVAAGGVPAQVVKSARPPVFFKRHNAVARQLVLWPVQDLEEAAEKLFTATAETRVLATIEAQIAERCLMSLGLRAARAARRMPGRGY